MTLNIAYDLGKAPASWDFLQWLINAEIARKELGHDSLGVAFVPGPWHGFRDDSNERPVEARKAILNNVMRPALALIGATESDYGETQFCPYLTRNCVEYHRKGGTVPFWRVPDQALDEAGYYLRGRKPVVVTLREASYHTPRNSNLPAWQEFAKESKEDVIFVRDTAKADESLPGFETCPRASKELLFRAALMQLAKANLMVSNGPWILPLYSDWPWLNFGCLRPEMPGYSPGTEKWALQQMGVPPGGQFPWARPNQRMIWAHDVTGVILTAWEEMSSTANRRRRRQINKHWQKQFESIRRRSRKYGDQMLHIDTIEMYEGIDDKPADMIVACDILEHLPEPGKALVAINQLARKSIMICVKIDHMRGEEFWRNLINKHLNVGDWLCEHGHIVAICQAGMKVQGIKVSGALSDETRWEHVQASLQRFPKRIVKGDAHDRRAILACYGPSLTRYLPKLREELKEENAVLVSVSGAHDFLIQNDLMPDYHIECDPRPHKTDNINLPSDKVRYLIASCCHPSYFDRLQNCDVTLWHVSCDHNVKLIDEMKESSDSIVSCGGAVGLRAIPLLHTLGFRQFSVYGMDCSFSDDGEQQWAGRHAGKRQELTQCKCGDRIFTTSPVLVAYAGQFFDILRRLPDSQFRMWGDGLLQAMCRMYWTLPQIEQTEPGVRNAA